MQSTGASVIISMLFASGLFAIVDTTRVPGGGIQPQSVVDDRGVVHMVYLGGDPGAADVFYVKSTDHGKTFSTPMQVNSQKGSAIAKGTIRGAQISVGKNGRVHVAWNGTQDATPKGPGNPEDGGKAGSPMLYARLNDAGTGFEAQRNLMTLTYGLDGGGSIAADNLGNVYVAWHGKGPSAAAGEAGRRVWMTRSSDEGKTFSAEAAASDQATGACGCCGMKLFADRAGTLYGLYRSATNNVHRDIYLLVSHDHGKSFQSSLMDRWEINACPMSSESFAENAGEVVAAWETGGQVFYARVDGKHASAPKKIAAPGDGKGRKHPVVAVNDDGEVLLAWTEGTGWQKGGSLAWQLYRKDGSQDSETVRKPGIPAWSMATVFAEPSGFEVAY